MSFDALRTRFALSFLDAVETAPLRPEQRFGTLLRSLWRRGSNYDRAGSAVRLVDALIPGAAQRASRLLRRTRHLPVRLLGTQDDPVEVVGYGAGATVYALGEGPRRRVLKVYRRSLGRDAGTLLDVAAHYRAQHRTIEGWYADLPELLPRTEFLVLHGPLCGLRAACSVQDFLPAPRTDLFEQLSLGPIPAAAQQEVRRFAERTLELWRDRGQCIDILGRDNVVLCEPGPRRHLIDSGILRLGPNAPDPGAPDAVRRRVEARMQELEAFLARTGGSA